MPVYLSSIGCCLAGVIRFSAPPGEGRAEHLEGVTATPE
jgi:hypothetical protein